MRRFLYLLSALAVSACGDDQTGGETSASQPSVQARDTVLARCSEGQNAVADALQGSDEEVLMAVIDQTIADCRSASSTLRNADIDGLETIAAADAIDQMTDGLSEVRTGVELMNRSPDRARATAQAGMARYKVGLERLNATTQ